MNPLIVDCLASGKGTKHSTLDVIGAGPRTVAGVLEKHGYSPRIATVSQYLGEKKGETYTALLVSGMTSDLTAIRRTVKKWKKAGKGPAIVGGPAASEPVRVLEKTRADIAVTGEAEHTLAELLNLGLLEGGVEPDQLSQVRGLSFWSGRRVMVTPLRPRLPPSVFTDYPPSTSTITDYGLSHAARVYVEAVRGCSNFNRARIGEIGGRCIGCEQCTEGSLTERYDCPEGIPPGCGYCSVPSLYGPPKSRPADLIIDETRRLLDLGVHRIVLSAPGFLDYMRERLVEPEPLTDPRSPDPNLEAVEELLQGLTSLPALADESASLMLENLKAGLVTVQAAQLLGRYLPGTPVSVGFETGSMAHSRQLGRPDTPPENLLAVRRLRAAGLKPYVYFIHGLPGQTLETAAETVDSIKGSVDAGAERVILYRFQSLPFSCFMGEPGGPPAAVDPVSSMIHEAAGEANQRSKRQLVGERLRVVGAEVYRRDPRYTVCYPLLHGPVVLVEGGESLIGAVFTVRVTGAASERMVYAAFSR